ncbi:iron hydrogenase [Patescibacteria group bacterium]|nr:iron hydrogenase [Patescibacteria group bacterium]MBU1895679.1 iron hydrogenase [Patescibacteria group bacterium]
MNTKILTLNKERVTSLVVFITLISVASIAPLFHNQPITGPIVNATLFIAVALLGTETAIMVGLIPSLIALSVGLLPAVLAPMVPFIMMGNALMIWSFSVLNKKNFWAGIITASLLKFLFLWGPSTIAVNLLLKKEVASTVATMMSWPQLWTAVVGGLIAFVVLKGMKKV